MTTDQVDDQVDDESGAEDDDDDDDFFDGGDDSDDDDDDDNEINTKNPALGHNHSPERMHPSAGLLGARTNVFHDFLCISPVKRMFLMIFFVFPSLNHCF